MNKKMTGVASALEVLPDEENNKGGTIIIRTTEAKLREAEERMRDIQNLNSIPDSLEKLSLAACIFQFAQALFLFILASNSSEEFYWFTFYPAHDIDKLGGVPNPKQIAAFSVLWYSPVFILMSGFEHLCCIVFRQTYEYYIARSQNPFRWTEYSFSASLMRVMIAQLVGITDVHLLFCIYIMTTAAIQCPALHESVNAKNLADGYPQHWRPFFMGWLSHLSTWGVIFSYFNDGVQNGGQPSFLWTIIVLIFLWDTSFAVMFTLQWRKIGPFEDYVLGEKGFIMLSFSAKTLLAWISFAGVFE